MLPPLISPQAEQYASLHTSPDDDVLEKMRLDTEQHHPHAHMQSNHVQGRFLALMSKLIQPKYVLEIGTFTGYSALCLCEGLAEDGYLHTIELRNGDAHTALKNFKAAEKDERIILHTGDANDIIPTLPYEWDLVFIDADKVGYLNYYHLVLPRLTKKGVIIADNVLFHGQVLEEPVKGKSAAAIDAFNKHVLSDPGVEQVMLTIRDGLLIIKKKP